MKRVLGTMVMGLVVQLSGAESIGEQIEKIQNAPAQERVEMMNRLKLQIAQMNEAEREEALNALQQKGSHKRMQFQHQKMNDGSSVQPRQRMNTQTGGINRQQGRQ